MNRTPKRKKKITKKDTSHYFIDGYVSGTGTLGVVASPNVFKGTNTEWTTFFMYAEPNWACQTYNFDSRSVVSRPFNGDRAWWLLGKRGEIIKVGDEDHREDLPSAGTGSNRLGYVNKITLIESELYVCGYNRQVYMRRDDKWMHIDKGMVAPSGSSGKSLESMDGNSAKDIYAVGLDGEIWHYDGRHWDPIDSPTDAHLFEVCCLPQAVYAVGKNGVVVMGSGNHWEVLQNPKFKEDLWGVTAFQDNIYVSGYGGIARIEGSKIVPIDPGHGKAIRSYRLRTGPPGVIWSIGNENLLRFDGRKWEEIVCPDNK